MIKKINKKKQAKVQSLLTLANNQLQSGNRVQAINTCNAILNILPDYLDAFSLKALALQQAGQNIEAIDVIDQAIGMHPDNIEMHKKIAYLLTDGGKLSQLFEQFCVLINSANNSISQAYLQLGYGLQNTQHRSYAIKCFIFAVKDSPCDSSCWYALAKALCSVSITKSDPELESLLNKGFSVDGFDQQLLVRISLEILKADYNIGSILGSRLKDETLLTAQIKSGQLGSILTRELFINILKNAVVTDPGVELLLTNVRRIFLDLYAKGLWPNLDKNDYMLCAAIAHQSFNNEYVFYVTDEETRQIEFMAQSIDNVLAMGKSVDCRELILLATFIPLNYLENSATLAEMSNSIHDEELQSILVEQVHKPLIEVALKNNIRILGSITNDVSRTVQEQYEENPYPRWKTATHRKESTTFEKIMRGNYSYLNAMDYSFPDAPKILIAGCGTGRTAVQAALTYSSSIVQAVDLSLSSLAFATRKARELSVGNLYFAQADILDLEKQEERFDIIECTGVLHHMDDPITGWRILTSLLKTGGYMKIALYSKVARRFLIPAREYIKEKGYQATNQGIRQFRHNLMQMSDRKDLQPTTTVADFFSLSECRDLLFHSMEHDFTLPQIEAILDDLKLEFIGFDLPHPSIKIGYEQRFPDDPTARSLLNWHKYETDNPTIFTGMYQFWLRAVA